ncbi:unnamed protein product [Ectocarpus sp. 8 AP-2014]
MQVRIITTQAMAKLRDGCLPEERKKLMSYLSVYEPSTPSYSKGKYDPSKSRRNKRLATDSRASTSGASSSSSSSSRVGDGGDDSTTANAAGAAVDRGDANAARERDSSRRVVGYFSKIGKPGWMKPDGNESGTAGAGGAGAGSRFFRSKEEERRMWASRFSKMEQEHQRDDRARSHGVSGGRTVMGFNEVRDEKGEKQRREEEEERQLWGGGDRSGYPTTGAGRNTGDKQQQDRGVGVNGSSNGGGGSGRGVDNCKGDERRPWDFSKHGQEELQHELTRYLRKHRLAKKNAEKAAALKAENPAAAAQAAGVAARTTRRRKTPPPTTAAPPAVVAAAGTNNPASSGRSTDGARAAAVAAAEAAAERRRKRASATGSAAGGGGSSSGSRTTRLMGRYSSSALDLAQQEREERRRERQAAEEEWEREQAVRPLPVGNGAGSVVIGDLEPVANSREADQLEHLSRLLWDGEEEPADFSLSYGKKPKRGGPLE